MKFYKVLLQKPKIVVPSWHPATSSQIQKAAANGDGCRPLKLLFSLIRSALRTATLRCRNSACKLSSANEIALCNERVSNRTMSTYKTDHPEYCHLRQKNHLSRFKRDVGQEFLHRSKYNTKELCPHDGRLRPSCDNMQIRNVDSSNSRPPDQRHAYSIDGKRRCSLPAWPCEACPGSGINNDYRSKHSFTRLPASMRFNVVLVANSRTRPCFDPIRPPPCRCRGARYQSPLIKSLIVQSE